MIAARSLPSGARLPRWCRWAFWAFVGFEWSVALSAVGILALALGYVLSSADCDSGMTIYTTHYSEAAWKDVNVGDTRAAVQAALGGPLQQWPTADGQLWSYSRQAASTENYIERKLRFNSAGIVVEKHDECYID